MGQQPRQLGFTRPMAVDYLGLGVGLCTSSTHTARARKRNMDAIENIALMSALMLAGVSVTVVVLIGFIYFLETQND